MDDSRMPAESGLQALSYGAWRARMLEDGEAAGFGEPLGAFHHAVFREEGDTLLVSFESFPGIQATSESGYPLGEAVADAHGWSHLSLVSRGDTWFRSLDVYGFFDQLNDDGFFDDFDRVLFYGAGPCGYAAAASATGCAQARLEAPEANPPSRAQSSQLIDCPLRNR